MKRYILILLLAMSCTEEETGPCAENARRCKEILEQMDKAKTDAEKDQLHQFYLSEKQILDNCRKHN